MDDVLKNLKDIVETKAKRISASWSISPSVGKLTNKFEDELADILAYEIKSELTFETYTNNGYYGILKPSDIFWDENEITDWLKTNCAHDYIQMKSYCLFENKNDAVQFNLVYG